MLGILGLDGIIKSAYNKKKGGGIMACGHCEPKKMAKYVCSKCGKVEMKEVKEGEVVKSCCGQVMNKKE